tara:strand:+ start:5025 stop:10463 length:5439 start_codon:yes stop_codon:yes gene_type:complete
MAEIRRTFQAGKMNKSLDERVVPNGEYRDALNIEVRTSDDNDAGAVQLLSGNIQRLEHSDFGSMNPTESFGGEKSCFVGSIANERTNKAYFFIASPNGDDASPNPAVDNGVTAVKLYKDMIVEYDTVTKTIKPVVVDVFKVHANNASVGASITGTASDGYTSLTISSGTQSFLANLRPGMIVRAQTSTGVSLLTSNHNYGNDQVRIKSIGTNSIVLDKELHGPITGTDTTAATWTFTSDPVLGYHTYSSDSSKVITGINIIEDMLFWTDNKTEPKKINITRSMAGSPDFNTHTKLYISNPSSMAGHLVSLDYVDEGTDASLLEEHITVIKRAPRCAPKLEMSLSARGSVTTGNIQNQSFVYASDVINPEDSSTLYSAGTPFNIGHVVPNVVISGANFLIEDIIILSAPSEDDQPLVVRARVTHVGSNNSYTLAIISASSQATASDTNWDVKLEKEKALFELKFGRFAYRYKYQDGEYSSFSPWSELAFLGGAFDYVPAKGYNLGMVNNARQIKITDFVVEDVLRPDDVVAVDILYKDTTSPNCYIVKTIERGRHSEWNDASSGGNSGVINITSEMIHRTLPSSQILRAWDNVPRVAKAQEVTGNRLVYGNYLQNFDVNQPITIDQGLVVADHPYLGSPCKSLKSIRKYKIGVVYGDKYGRETPVMGMGGMTVSSTDKATVMANTLKADVSNPKKNCDKKTKLRAKQVWKSGGANQKSYVPSGWMEYYKYYVKETTNEYYNLVLDRWYNAEDGNVWLSFQSADRNKLDEETYIILKNGHGDQQAIVSEARYKILAIENEAPDFIKTTQKIKGDLEVTQSNGNGMTGIPTSMVAKFDSNGWQQVFKGISFKGIGFARIKGVSGSNIAYSQWVKIARLNHEQYTVTTTEPFGESANMTVVLGNSSAQYFLQIKDAVVENRPEFDGRFFVKVQKNSTLASAVLQQTSDGLEYATTHSFKHAYIRNNRYNPATSGTHANTQWSSGGGVEFGNSNVDQMGMCGEKPKTRAFWVAHGSGGFSGGAKWFLDQTRFNTTGENYQNRRGLYSRSGISGMSAMDFSVRSNSWPDANSIDGKFRSLMTTPGTLFRFRTDPNKIVYEVKGSANPDYSRNYQKNMTWCNECLQKHPSCNRKTFTTYFTRADNPSAGVNVSEFDPRGEILHTGKSHAYIDVVDANYTYSESIRFTEGNAIWETEPKEDVGMDLYYEASNALPIKLSNKYAEQFAPKLAPITVERESEGTVFIANEPIVHSSVKDIVAIRDKTSNGIYPFRVGVGDLLKFHHDDGTVTSSKVIDHYKAYHQLSDTYAPSTTHTITVNFNETTPTSGTRTSGSISGFDTTSPKIWEITTSNQSVDIPKGTFITTISGSALTFTNSISIPGSATVANGVSCTVKLVTGCYRLDSRTYLYETELGWFNCYSFGNGLESDRIRDDYNAPTIDNGVKVSTTLDKYGEERRGSGMIYSGIYNSTSGVNELNEFNMAEPITKDLNPTYGTIQALKSRDTNLVSFCEDKVLKILANKDALFNADGSSNVTASNAVLGDAKAFVGDYGISSNPESLAVDSYRMYFTDKQRGKVLRLSQDGLTPISDVGMTSWFRENLKSTYEVLGTFDEVKGEYNVTLKYPAGAIVTQGYENKTVSFSEGGKGWVSFKSFIPETGLSMNGEYITGAVGPANVSIWTHHDETVNANNFYGTQYTSTIDVMFNDNPNVVKAFNTISYEGTQAYVTQNLSDDQYYNLTQKNGWSVSSIETDQQKGQVYEFIEKEGKWFNYILGQETNASNYLTNLDISDLSVQGLGSPSSVTGQTEPTTFILTIEEQGGD